jgi:proline iminopeptidase
MKFVPLLLAAAASLLAATCCGATPARATHLTPREGFVAVDGGPIWYRILGSGDATPVILVHGGPGGRSCNFDPMAMLLSRHRPVVLYDQLGTGRSGRPQDPTLWTLDRSVGELAALRRALKLHKAHLVGHSWGAALVAQYVIGSKPRGIRSVVLAGPLLSTERWIADANTLRTLLPEKTQEALTRNERLGTTHSTEYVEATEEFYSRFLYHQAKHPVVASCAGAPGSDEIYEFMWGPTEFHATGTLRDFDVTSRLHEIRSPVLFTAGRYDEARPETVAAFSAMVPGSRLEILENSGHMAPVEEPARFADILEQFFEAADAEAPRSRVVPATR